MDAAERMLERLKTEYGIETMEELNEAISNLEKIDIAVFCQKESA